MDLNKAKNNYATYISQLNEAIRQSGITKIKSSIAPRYSGFLGQRGYRIEFDKNFDGEIPQNSEITLYDTRGNETKDPQIIINYLKALTKKINKQGLSKKNGFLSEFFDKLSGGVNLVEDLARNLTKFSLNYCVVKHVVKFIDFVANTNIHQNLKDNHYFDIHRETKGVSKFFDPSKLVSSVCNLAFRPTRFALRFADKVSSIFFPVTYKSHYFPTITQKDLNKIKNEETRRPVSSKSASHDGLDPNLTRSKSLPNRPRPNMHQSKRSKSVGQSSPYWTPQTDHKPHDPFSSYQNPYYPLLAPTRDLPQNTRSFSGGRYGLTPEQTSALFMEAIGSSKSSNSQNSRVYGGGVKVTTPMPVHHPRGLYGCGNQEGVVSGGGRGGRVGRGGCGR